MSFLLPLRQGCKGPRLGAIPTNLCQNCRWLKSNNKTKLRVAISLGHYLVIKDRTYCAICQLVIKLLDSGVFQGDYEVSLRLTLDENCGPYLHVSTVGSQSFSVGSIWLIHPDDIDQSNDGSVSLTAIKNGLDLCTSTHDICKKALPCGPAVLLIDVVENCLVQRKPGDQYVTLSYVWGEPSTSQTVKANFLEFKRPQSLDPKRGILPRVVMDAMLLVAGIGQRYLWCDRFCIIQDDGKHKHDQIANMDKIFGGAFLTIAAISGTDSQDPLPGIRPGTRSPSSIIKLDGAVAMFSKHPHHTFSHNLAESVYEQRGWTFQERLLSKRCLYVTKNGLYYECGTGLYHESNLTTPIPRLPPSEIEFKNGSLPLLNNISYFLDKSNFIDIYQTIVAEYTNRNLTFPTDVLNAISGVLSHLGQSTQTVFVSGLSASLLEQTLFWIPRYALRRRTCQIPGQGDRYPSWSWAGWHGCVDFLVTGKHIAPTIYKFSVRSGNTTLNLSLQQFYQTSVQAVCTRQVTFSSKDAPGMSICQDCIYDQHILEFVAQVRDWDAFRCFGEVKSFHEKERTIGFQLYDREGTPCGVLVHPNPVIPERGDIFILLARVDPSNIQKRFIDKRLRFNDAYIMMLARPSANTLSPECERLALGYVYGEDVSNWRWGWGSTKKILLV